MPVLLVEEEVGAMSWLLECLMAVSYYLPEESDRTLVRFVALVGAIMAFVLASHVADTDYTAPSVEFPSFKGRLTPGHKAIWTNLQSWGRHPSLSRSQSDARVPFF